MPPHYYILLLGLFLLHGSPRGCCAANMDTLTAGQALAAGDKLVSRNSKFALGFFSSSGTTSSSKSSLDNNTTSNWYLGIWFNKVPDFTPVWIANRDEPITHRAGLKLKLVRNDLCCYVVLGTGGAAETLVWSTEISKPSNSSNGTIAVLTHYGNLVVQDSHRVLWQSFDYPTDVFLPGSKLGRNKVTGLNRVFISKKNRIDPGRGSYCVGVDPSLSTGIILSHCASSVVYWASGTFSQQNVDPSDSGLISYDHVDDNQEQYYNYSITNESLSIFTFVETSGQIKARVWVETQQRWHQFYTQPMDPCSVHAACGPFTICTNSNANLSCDCMRGFSVKSPAEWDLDDRAGGCTRNNQLNCTTDKFLPIPGVTLAYDPVAMNVADADDCRQACASDCSCTAYSYTSSGGCSIWNGELLNTAVSTTAGEILYLRLAAKDLPTLRENSRASSVVVVVAACSAGSAGIVVLILLFIIWWRTNRGYVLPSSSTQQDYAGIRTFRYSHLSNATKKFSERIGGGGFGSVYKGLLNDSIAIAVKSLDGDRQGEKQFRAEVSSVGLIQHINLVKLIGFCCESDKRLLVYENMFHGSLDAHLFDTTDDTVLDWTTRYQIATGVARGLSYLHEGCRKCIIHCDIKPENILLDASFVPKIADFGMATIVGRDFSRVLTTFRGTMGYLAPEWLSGEAITQKVDVYSFGMVLLEIVSGRRNSPKVYTTGSYHTSYFPLQAISMLRDGDVTSLVDPQLRGEFNLEEAIRLCKVAFWCIQENEFDRPTMGEVVRALECLHAFDMPPMPRQFAAITEGNL